MAESHHSLEQVLIILGVALVAIVLFRRLRLPPIVAYLIVGACLGPHALGWVQSGPTTALLGEIGVAFLLFTIGLEFSLGQLRAMRDTLLGLGAGQVVVGTVSGALIAWAWGVPWQAALVVGGALALSSTALVVKQLRDEMQLQTVHGRISLGVLLFQDLAAVPFIVAIPILAQGEQLLAALGVALIKGLLALAAMLALGRWALRPLFQEVAASRFAELFTISVLLVSLAAAWLTAQLGLSLALGAFLAGMMLGETEFRHQIETDIRPIRDVLLGLFFITVGMRLDGAVIAAGWPVVLVLVAGLTVGKGSAIFLLMRVARWDAATALRAGAILAHGGEFSIALITLAMDSALLPGAQAQGILAAVVLSMLLAPLLIRRSGDLAALFPDDAPPFPDSDVGGAPAASAQVLLCGYGRTGRLMARVLRENAIPYVALDREPERVKQAWERGEPVFFGDASNRATLHGAGVDAVRAVVLTFADLDAEKQVVAATRELRHEVPILVRARDDEGLDELIQAGATEGVPETLEAALMLLFQLLVLLEIPVGRVLEHIRVIRSGRYPLLKGFFDAAFATAQRPRGTAAHEHLRTVILPAGATATGRRLADLGFEAQGILIASLRRPGRGVLSPTPDRVLQAGDVLVLHGTGEALTDAEGRLLAGSPRLSD